MKGFLFYFFYAFIWLLTLLPLRILYLISDFLYLLNLYVIRYRKKVIEKNLRNAFPEKSEKERRKIMKKFYRHFCDMIIEIVKIINFHPKNHAKRFRFKNLSLWNKYYLKRESAIIVSGHYGNWEWASRLPSVSPHKYYVTYQKLKNKRFDKLVNKIRKRYGVNTVLMQRTYKTVTKAIQKDEFFAIWLLFDQAPPKKHPNWTMFLNQPTQFYNGAEKMARKYNLKVIWLEIDKIKRGHYQASFRELIDEPQKTKPGEITKAVANALENQIRRRPEFWLWSHNRWKHLNLERAKELKEKIAGQANDPDL